MFPPIRRALRIFRASARKLAVRASKDPPGWRGGHAGGAAAVKTVEHFHLISMFPIIIGPKYAIKVDSVQTNKMSEKFEDH